MGYGTYRGRGEGKRWLDTIDKILATHSSFHSLLTVLLHTWTQRSTEVTFLLPVPVARITKQQRVICINSTNRWSQRPEATTSPAIRIIRNPPLESTNHQGSPGTHPTSSISWVGALKPFNNIRLLINRTLPWNIFHTLFLSAFATRNNLCLPAHEPCSLSGLLGWLTTKSGQPRYYWTHRNTINLFVHITWKTTRSQPSTRLRHAVHLDSPRGSALPAFFDNTNYLTFCAPPHELGLHVRIRQDRQVNCILYQLDSIVFMTNTSRILARHTLVRHDEGLKTSTSKSKVKKGVYFHEQNSPT